MSTEFDRLIARYIDFVVRFRWATLLGCLLAAFVIGRGVEQLGFATDYRVFFGEENPDLLAFDALEATYAKDDNVLFAIQPHHGDVFNERTLSLIAELTERAWQIPYSTRVDSITNFQDSRANGDELVVADLFSGEHPEATEIARVRNVSLTEPLLLGRLIAANGRTTGVNVRVELRGQSTSELPSTVAHIRALRRDLEERFPDHRFALTGSVMIHNAMSEVPKLDAPVLMPAMLGVLVVVMVLFLRSALATAATLTLVLLSAITALGASGYAGVVLDPASVSAPTIIVTLAVSDAIHVIIAFLSGLRAGMAREAALAKAFRVNTRPMFLTSLTTAVGFLSLNASDSPPIHTLGNVTAFGVIVAWVYAMTFLPAALAVLPIKAHSVSTRTSWLVTRLAGVVVSRPRSIAACLGVMILALLALIPTLSGNDRFPEYFSRRMPIRTETDFVREHLTSADQTSYSIESGEADGITDPRYLRVLDEFTVWHRSQPDVLHVRSFTDVMKRLNRNMHGDDPDFYRLPESRSLAAQYLLLYEMSLPYGLDLNDQISIDKSSTRMDVTYRNPDSRELIAAAGAGSQWLALHGTRSMREARGVGIAVMFGNIRERNIEGMLVGTGLGFGLIACILMVALGSLRLGLLSLVPNVLPAGMAFGVWALVVGEVGFAISVVAGLSIGIIVDDTVHFLAKYQDARRRLDYDAADAVRHAFEVVGPAIIGTSVIVAAGFAVLGLSNFRVTAYMGMLTSLAVVCALVTDLLLLPALLIMLDGRREPAASSDSSERMLSAPLEGDRTGG